MTPTSLLSPKREAQLVQQVQRGDRGALGELLGAYQKRVYHVCLRMVCHADDASDLTQDVLLRAVQHIQKFRGDSQFGTWLFRIAMNQSISHLRKRRVRDAVSLEAPTGPAMDDQAAPLKAMIDQQRELGPDQSVETMEQITQLTDAIDRLDVGLRTMIILRDLQELEYQDIADVLGIPLGTVKSRLFRARLALRNVLDVKTDKPDQ